MTVADFSHQMMDRFLFSMKDSVKFHEYKLFFILHHFDALNI